MERIDLSCYRLCMWAVSDRRILLEKSTRQISEIMAAGMRVLRMRFRTFGKKAGAITLLGDCLKCVLAIVIVRMVYGNSMNGILPLLTLYAALGCILGHNFPISMEFRGGKGIAASVGMIIAFDWRIFIVCAVVFFALFFTTHYVSLCSLSAYAVAFILVLVFGHMGKYGMDQAHTVELYIVMAVLTAMAFYRHRANIVRLFHGTENKVFLSSKNKK